MLKLLPHLKWLDDQHLEMENLLEKWVNINSHSENLPGLALMLEELKHSFSVLDGEMRQIPLPAMKKYDEKGCVEQFPLGEALSIKKHPEAPIQVLLGGHMDTVYPALHSFQNAIKISDNMMGGPGVSDMKGGLVVMLKALETLEKSPFAGCIGWEVLITPDEEIGSPGSNFLWTQAAHGNSMGLLFEPAFSDGALVSSRKGSINYVVISRGKPSHVGRDFHSGRNAITALARFLLQASELTDKEKAITVNIGKIQGGGPVNIVPDLAICHFNVRMDNELDFPILTDKLKMLIRDANDEEGISLELQKLTERPPKVVTEKTQILADEIQKSGEALGITFNWKHTGGVCDGNTLAAAGLPVIDTLGPIGGNIHTPEEYVQLDSLVERAKLAALFLLSIKG